MTAKHSLEELRQDVKVITSEIIRLVGKRLEASRKIGEVKRSLGLNFQDPEVERVLRQSILAECGTRGVDQTLGLRIFNLLVDSSIKAQEQIKPRVSHTELFEKSKAMEAEGRKIIHLEVGEPDFPSPTRVVEETQKALAQGHTHYTETRGIPRLRSALVEHVNSQYRADIKDENITITPGGRFAVYLSFAALLELGDEVVVFTPDWPAYQECAKLAGARVAYVRTKLEDGWAPNIEALESAISDSTRLIVLNNPSNPTGKIFDDNFLKTIAEVSAEKKLPVLCDEVYSDYAFKPFTSILKYPECNPIMIKSFSKSYAMTGYRVAYAVADHQLIKKMASLQRVLLTSVAEFVQHAASKALECGSDVGNNAEIIKKRMSLVQGALKELSVKFTEPEGGFYIFPKVLKDGFESSEFALELLSKKDVAVAPGTSFGEYPDHIRISVTEREESLEKGIAAIKELLN